MRHALFFACLAWAVTATAQVPTYVPTDGLIAWYPFNGNADDESGNNLNGEVHGAVPSPNRFGQSDSAYFFGGVFPQYIALPEINPNSGQSNSQTSISLWFLQESSLTSGTGQFIHASHQGYPEIFARIEVTEAGAIKIYHRNASTNNEPSGGNVPLGEWSFLCALIDQQAGSYSLWLNGEFVEEIEFTFDPSESYYSEGRSWEFGAISEAAPYHQFEGTIDDVSVHSRILSEAEIIGMYNASAHSPGCTDDTACNFDAEANVDDGSCIPSGCMNEGACNYNADAECEGEACDYSCCPGPGCCGDGMHWDADEQTCVITPPSVAPDTECTLLNLQELAEGYQILLAENAELDSLLADCNGTSTSAPSGPCSGEDVVTYHGYDYDIVEIGDQCWFAENLKTQQYSDGTSIPSGLSDQEWITTSVGAFANFDSEYGFLYNWFSVSDPRGLCPNSWHVSGQTDWDSLEAISSSDFPIALKSSPAQNPSWDGNNQLAFNAVPAGRRRNSTGAFDSQLSSSYFWLKDNGDYYRLGSGSTDFTSGNNSCCERAGFSVRCVKD